MSETVVLRGPERPDLLRHEVLADIFEATAYARPEQIALMAGERQLSYEQLDAEANRAAHRLIEAGIGPGDVIRSVNGRPINDSSELPPVIGAMPAPPSTRPSAASSTK